MNDLNCRVGKTYGKCCNEPGEVCDPVEGSFCTECNVDQCNKFC